LEQKAQGGEGEGGKGAKKGEEGEKDPLAGIPDLDPNEFDPALVKTFNGLKELIRTQHESIKELKGAAGKETEATKQAEQARAVEEGTLWFDGEIAKLGEEVEPILGKGGRQDIKPDSAEFQKRGELADRMSFLAAGYHAIGQDVPERGVLFAEAVKDVLGPVKKKLAERGEKHTSRPTKRQGSKPTKTAQEEAAEEIDKKFFGET